jgi:hypothetical protein
VDSKVVPGAKRIPPNAGKGRVKGVPNKITGDIKAMVLGALEKAHKDGGIGYLVEQSEKNPTAFMGLVGKVLPLTLAGDADSPLKMVTRIELVAGDNGQG